MKYILFFISLWCITSNIQAQYTSIPDAIFESYLETHGMGDGINNNGQVLTANINTVIELNVNNQNIGDLTGIEDFSALEVLICNFNNLTTINLSQNTALTEFYCSFNGLTSLDLSQNTALTFLVCSNNFLTSLDLSQNNNLVEVHCYENFITNLTINSPFLYWLDCSYNSLTSLEVTSPILFWLYCQHNSLTSLDVSQNIALEYLSCHYNNLTSLDVGQNIILTYFSCSHNNINSLDTSQNPQLINFSCGYNNIESLDISQNSNINILGVGDNAQLIFLDARNGNNESIGFFSATLTNLDCIFVDDASAVYLEDWYIDPDTNFVNNEQECENLSVAGFEQDNFAIYPNPTKNTINISTTKRANYTLLTVQGKIIKTGVLREGTNNLSMINLSSGFYLLKVYSNDGITTKKVIKE